MENQTQLGPNAENNERFRNALESGQVAELLETYHSADVGEYFGVTQTTVEKFFRGNSNAGKERVMFVMNPREMAIRSFVVSSKWTLENAARLGL